MKLDKLKKKRLLAVIAVVLVIAMGAGIWFGVGGKAEPVNVYPFVYVGMTEFWGDSQESYGPVSTDNIQTVYLSDTQTVTEILAAEGDEVKKGDVLMTFDTTLTELELERKRLDVERQKLELLEAEAQLKKIRNMKPMDPNAMNPPILEPEEPDLGEILIGKYTISENKEFDGSEVNKALILWMKDGVPVNDPVLRAVYLKALEFQTANANKQNSSASAVPEMPLEAAPGNNPVTPPANDLKTPPADNPVTPAEDDPVTPPANDLKTPPADNPVTPPENDQVSPPQNPVVDPPTPDSYTVNISIKCNGQNVDTIQKDVSVSSVRLNNAYTYQGKTYWFQSATRVSDGQDLITYTIPAYPQGDANAQAAWEAKWSDGITVEYIRSVSIRLPGAKENDIVQLEPGRDTALCFYASMEDAPKNGVWTWEITATPEDAALQAAPDGNFLTLSGKAGKAGELVTYTVSATYTFTDLEGTGRAVKAEFPFATKVVEEAQPGEPAEDFYVIIKVTEGDTSRGPRLIWQGMHVFCYEDGFGYTLFDASALEDHTLEPLEEEDTELPDIDFGSGYTLAEIVKMRTEQEKKVKEQKLTLRMAEAEYKIMQAEVNDGKVCADFDGKVVSVITEEEARQDKRPLLKVSAGGGFYVDGAVSELEKDNLKVGQEVTVNDWETGQTYTGTVQSIGDFPSRSDSWNGMGNPNASYYPFTAFIDGEADLQAGRYVSVTYSTGGGGNGVYLENPFVRTENGRSYVYVRGENGKLEKRFVTVGKSLWGSYTEIKGGLTEEDFIAFPYGKTVKEGAPTAEGDYSALYAY